MGDSGGTIRAELDMGPFFMTRPTDFVTRLDPTRDISKILDPTHSTDYNHVIVG
jgi:hypothetical protein